MKRQLKNSATIRWLAVLATALALAMRAEAGGIPCRYDVIATIQGPECPPHGPALTTATAISPNGQYVCGYYRPCGVGLPQGWYWTAATGLVTIALPPGSSSCEAYDVSDAGLVVGEYQGFATGSGRGFIYDINNGSFVTTLVSVNFGGRCAINAINSSGTVCGWRSIGSGNDPINPYQAFIWSQRTGYIDLGVMNGPNSGATDISDSGIVVGWTGPGEANIYNSVRAFIQTDRGLIILPPVPNGINSLATSIGSDGAVLINGRTQIDPYLLKAFLFDVGEWTALPIPPGFNRNFAHKIGANNLVGGNCTSTTSPGASTACLWASNSYRLVNASTIGQFVGIAGGIIDISIQGLAVLATQNIAGEYLAYLLEPRESTLGDMNCDGLVNIDDLVGVITNWGPCANCPTDFNNDHIVNLSDLVTVIQNWTAV